MVNKYKRIGDEAYRDTTQVETIKNKLIGFGFPKLDARYLAREIATNLNNYGNIMDMFERQRAEKMSNTNFKEIVDARNRARLGVPQPVNH